MLTITEVQKFIFILFMGAFILMSVHTTAVSIQSRDDLKRQVNARHKLWVDIENPEMIGQVAGKSLLADL